MSQSLIDCAVDLQRASLERFVRTLGAVPDSRLTWKPFEGSRSAWEIAAHLCLGHLLFLGPFLQPLASSDALWGDVNRMLQATDDSDRDDLVGLVIRTGNYLDQALASLSPDDLNKMVPSPFGVEMRVRELLLFPSRHLDSHAGQIDYLQTMWGDFDDHW